MPTLHVPKLFYVDEFFQKASLGDEVDVLLDCFEGDEYVYIRVKIQNYFYYIYEDSHVIEGTSEINVFNHFIVKDSPTRAFWDYGLGSWVHLEDELSDGVAFHSSGTAGVHIIMT